ncbi:hypothetical protein, partial [Microbacterium sp. NPDC096154]|uniref:hypothetical protein n=1 Tax=Microbacterium sp. NPDC096154 TaxID=3155549 RepID=UPI0033197FEB
MRLTLALTLACLLALSPGAAHAAAGTACGADTGLIGCPTLNDPQNDGNTLTVGGSVQQQSGEDTHD